MKVSDAKICLDCDEVYHGDLGACPGCGSGSSVYLKNWLAPLPTKKELDEAKRQIALESDVRQLVVKCSDAMAAMIKDITGEDPEPIGVC